MRVTRIIIVPALLATSLAVAAPAAADVAAQTAPTRASADKNVNEKGERLICKRFDATESRMKSKRICHTAEDWRRIERNDL